MQKANQPTTLWELLERGADDATAIVVPETGERISYADLRGRVFAMAEALAGAGVARGERVAMALPNGLPAVVAFLAASVAGTSAPLNPGYREEEFRFYMEDTAARVLLVPPEGMEAARAAAASMNVPVLAVDAAARLDAPRRSCAPPSAADVALVLHTSGSTGRPKRVPLAHGKLAVSAKNVVDTYQLTPADVSLCVMPLFHVHGLVASTLGTLLSGGTLVVPGKFNALSFWRTLNENKVTWYSAVPTIHQLALSRVSAGRPQGAERLRFIRSCSAPLPVETAKKMEESIGVPVLEAYGMTEASHQMASNPLPPLEHKFGTVGRATGLRIGIMDEAGNLLEPGQLGEVVIQGPNVVDGYENNPEANATSFTNGWFRTGDQGSIDAEGYLKLTGRLKEMINRGGEKISPVEIDEVLLAHPAVAEAVAFGVPHKTWGEEVSAAVVLGSTATEAEIIAYCKERLADYKMPKTLHVLKAIPRTATGKIQRRNVAATLAAETR
ncbi:MAG: AMP-binding protein [Acidimicrobiia bacterium]|nr:AMP-binding protein [Acidimicrobiia bacterium]